MIVSFRRSSVHHFHASLWWFNCPRGKIHRTLSSWTTDLYDTRSFSQLFSRQARVQHRLDRGDRLRAWWPECTSPKPWFFSGSIEVDIPGRSWKIFGEYLEYLRMNRNYTWTTDWNPFRSDFFGGWNNDQDNGNQFNMYTTVYWCLLYIWVLHCDLPTSAARCFHIFPKFKWNVNWNLALGDVNLIVPDGRVEHHSTWRWNGPPAGRVWSWIRVKSSCHREYGKRVYT